MHIPTPDDGSTPEEFDYSLTQEQVTGITIGGVVFCILLGGAIYVITTRRRKLKLAESGNTLANEGMETNSVQLSTINRRTSRNGGMKTSASMDKLI
jgi:hypothetical protein